MKTCAWCAEDFPDTREYFHKNAQTTDGLHSYCKKCRRERNKIYRANPEIKAKMLKVSMEWALNNPERTREIGRKYDKSLKATLKRRERTGAVPRMFKNKENRFPQK